MATHHHSTLYTLRSTLTWIDVSVLQIKWRTIPTQKITSTLFSPRITNAVLSRSFRQWFGKWQSLPFDGSWFDTIRFLVGYCDGHKKSLYTFNRVNIWLSSMYLSGPKARFVVLHPRNYGSIIHFIFTSIVDSDFSIQFALIGSCDHDEMLPKQRQSSLVGIVFPNIPWQMTQYLLVYKLCLGGVSAYTCLWIFSCTHCIC